MPATPYTWEPGHGRAVSVVKADIDQVAFSAAEIKTLHTLSNSAKRWVLTYFTISVSGATTVTIQDDQGTPEIYDELDFGGRSHVLIVYPFPGVWAESTGSKLNIKSSAAVSVAVHARVYEDV